MPVGNVLLIVFGLGDKVKLNEVNGNDSRR